MPDLLILGLIAGFPVLFAALWFAVTSLIGAVSGWYGLMARYPDRDETAVATIRPSRALMGRGALTSAAKLNGVLTLAACRSGLRLSIWRAFGPFCKPIFMPWSEIRPEPRRALFANLIRLGFGNPEAGALTVDEKTWGTLAPHAGVSG